MIENRSKSEYRFTRYGQEDANRNQFLLEGSATIVS
jgi:hypothetical protein